MSNSDNHTQTHPIAAYANAPDQADLLQQEWALARPDLPVRSIGIITRIWQISKLLSDDRRKTMNQLGMEPAIRDLLANLRRSGPPYRLRVSELAMCCEVSKGAITQRVERAEAAGLVRSVNARDATTHQKWDKKSTAEMDRRAVWIELTPEGKDLVETTVEALLHHEDHLVADLGDEDIKALSDALRRLLHVLNKQ
ncbi:MarR family winged helix-turn-helix transcriptional regulator [Rhizobium sp.]|jgi:DNA-binding MarR family transcriptional regulator|uniref:MarR family winged helix-turn-helix transcriptional regulator n=1 Tax=Rhizobium sp. TaxID=391 RepID=UPI000E80962E|nr:MarR family transcriptional regulator [Rhizobium sp.]